MRAIAVVIVSLKLLIGAHLASGVSANEIAVIVNERNPVQQINQDDLADYFLKRKKHWPDGTIVRFIDKKSTQPEHEVFLRHFVGRSPRDVDLYWIGQKLYTGNSAPIQVDSDAMAISLVKSFRGAVSYIKRPANRIPGVKELKVKRQ